MSAGGILSVGADVSLALGQFGEKVQGLTDAIHKWISENPRQDPFPFPIANSVGSGASAPTFLVIPLISASTQTGPAGGYRWGLGRISVCAGAANAVPDPSTVVASTVVMLFKSGSTQPSGTILQPTGLICSSLSDAVVTIPWSKQFPAHAVTVNPTEDLYVVCKGVGNNVNVLVEAEMLIFGERRYMQP